MKIFKSSSCFCHQGVFSKGGATNPLFQFFSSLILFLQHWQAHQPPIAKSTLSLQKLIKITQPQWKLTISIDPKMPFCVQMSQSQLPLKQQKF